MLKIDILGQELFDEKNNKVIFPKKNTIEIEHSLYSISKWEEKYEKPFLKDGPKSIEEWIDYIKMMTITENVKEEIYNNISQSNIKDIMEYINKKSSASIVKEEMHRASNKFITSEVIYSWMIDQGIPFECDKWHLNRLIMLIKVCTKENGPHKKMSQRDILSQQMMLNRMRRKR